MLAWYAHRRGCMCTPTQSTGRIASRRRSPLLKLSTALRCLPIVQDNSPEWDAWVQRTSPLFVAELTQWEQRWQTYLDTSVEPPTMPTKPFNHFRRRVRTSTRGYLPWQ